MRKGLIILVLVLLLSAAAGAKPCRFGNVSPNSPDALNLAGTAFEKLFDALGGSQLSSQSLRAWAESKDPFSPPENAGKDLGSLRSRLAELRQLIEASDWDLKPVNDALLDIILQRAEKLSRVNRKQSSAVKANTITPLGKQTMIRLMPGPSPETLVVASQTGKVALLDVKTGASTPLGRHPESAEEGTYTLDGQSYVYGLDDHLGIAPVDSEGKVEWKKSRRTGEQTGKKRPHPDNALVMLTPVGNLRRGWIYSTTRHKQGAPRFFLDVKKGELKPLTYPGLGSKLRNSYGWGPIGGTTDFFIQREYSGSKILIERMTVDKNGKVSQKGTPIKVTGFRSEVLWPNERGPLIVYGDIDIVIASPTSEKVQKIDLGFTDPEVYSVSAQAGLPYFIAVAGESPGAEVKLIAFDSKKGNRLAEIRLPKGLGTQARLLPDGTAVITDFLEGDHDQQSQIHSVPIGDLVPLE